VSGNKRVTKQDFFADLAGFLTPKIQFIFDYANIILLMSVRW